MNTATDTVHAIYAAFALGDVPAVLGALAPDVFWTEAEGGPFGGVYVGPTAVLEGVFMRIVGEWDGYTAIPRETVASDEVVVVLGDYSATCKATGKSFQAPFAHVWKLQHGKVAVFQQFTDTALQRQAMA
ncbi:MAG: nuclear transport factor 2 family protein [Pseudomarimonas sp.]